MTQAKEITERLQWLVAESWIAQAHINPADLSDPLVRAAMLQLRENLNEMLALVGKPPGFDGWPMGDIRKRATELAKG